MSSLLVFFFTASRQVSIDSLDVVSSGKMSMFVPRAKLTSERACFGGIAKGGEDMVALLLKSQSEGSTQATFATTCDKDCFEINGHNVRFTELMFFSGKDANPGNMA